MSYKYRTEFEDTHTRFSAVINPYLNVFMFNVYYV